MMQNIAFVSESLFSYTDLFVKLILVVDVCVKVSTKVNNILVLYVTRLVTDLFFHLIPY